ncbi:HEPN domain-containing protein [Rhodobacter viridis]|uniref:hypothetical protein n=1 Tax=Rhodobacter viridis TaxID=1054202 RepID=UPI0011B65ADB|nr:hypothetical protein [Rhodobacter viridis]
MIESVVDAAKASLVVDLFAVPAIEDYVVARWAYLNGLKRQYYWSASQALEKLLKASLISANVEVKKDSHHIAKMSAKLEALGPRPSLTEPFSTVEPHKLIRGTQSDPMGFIAQIDQYGAPNSRYRLLDFVTYEGDIHRFDETFFRIIVAWESIASVGKNGNPGFLPEHWAFSSDARDAAFKGNRIFQSTNPAHLLHGDGFCMARTPKKMHDYDSEPLKSAMQWLRGLAQLG